MTAATRAAALKYPWIRDVRAPSEERPPSFRWRKFSVYNSEMAEFDDVWTAMRLSDGVQTLEASIMDVADDIVYALHDLEDFYCARLLPVSVALEQLLDYDGSRGGQGRRTAPFDAALYCPVEDLATRLQRQHPEVYDAHQFQDAVSAVARRLLYMLLPTFDGSRSGFATIRSGISTLVSRYVGGVAVVEGGPSGGVTTKLRDKHLHEVQVLKELTRLHVIQRADLATVQRGQVRVLLDVAEQLRTWMSRDSRRLPQTLKDYVALAGGGPAAESRASRLPQWIHGPGDGRLVPVPVRGTDDYRRGFVALSRGTNFSVASCWYQSTKLENPSKWS